MKRIVVLALAFCLVATTAFAATPAYLSDLPKSHWAYEAVALLAKEGIIDGYPDKTFQGDKAMTRYEMAQVVVKAMANQNKANIAQRALIEKLASEFALDMNKIKSRVDKVEKEQQRVKFSGELSEQYKSKKQEGTTESYGQEKFRLDIVGQVDSNTTLRARIADPAPNRNMFKDSTHYKYGEWAPGGTGRLFDRIYGTTKIAENAKLSLGRQPLYTDPDDILVDSDFFSYDGVALDWKIGGVANINFERGRFVRGLNLKKNDDLGLKVAAFPFNGNAAADFANLDVQSVSANFDLGKAQINAGVTEFDKSEKGTANQTLISYSYGQLEYAFDDMFLVSAMVGSNTKAISEGGFNSFKAIYGYRKLDRAGKQNVSVMRSSFNKNALYFAYSSIDCPDEKDAASDAFVNWDFAWKLALSKNLSLKLEYGDIKDRTQPAQSYQFWKITTKWKF